MPGAPTSPSPILRTLASILLGAALLSHASSEESTPSRFLIEKSAASHSRETVFLNLLTATLHRDSLELHICFRNLGPDIVPSHGILTNQDYRLHAATESAPASAKDVDPSVSLVSPPDGIPPQLSNAGKVVFPKPGRRENLELRVAGFDPVRFSLADSRRFTPLSPAETATARPEITLHSSHSHLGVFPCTISRVRVGDKEITVDLAFTNTSNRSLFIESAGIAGTDALLVDGAFRLHRPARVSTSLQKSIGPAKARWSAGESHAGTVVFNRPHPHALRHLLITFPGYDSALLTFDEAKRSYTTEIRKAGTPSPSGAHPLRVSGELDRELASAVARLGSALAAGDRSAYLARFALNSTARAHQVAFLETLARAGVDRLGFKLVPEQPLELASPREIKDVRLFLEYGIEGIPGDNPFRSILECDFVRESEDAPWRIHRWLFTKQPPFWLFGYTARETSERFIVYHRPGALPDHRIAASLGRLEEAYRRLEKNGHLRLDERFVAFLVDRETDFKTLTDQDPTRYHGVASTAYANDGDRFLVLNRAMYLNEYKLLLEERTRDASAKDNTIEHELVHLALAPETRPFTPPWLVEGVAVHFAGQLSADTRRAVLDSGRLPAMSLSALSRGRFPGAHMSGREQLNYEYILAGEAVELLIRTYGEERFFDFYRAFAGISPAELDQHLIEHNEENPSAAPSIPKLMHRITVATTQRHFGISLFELDKVVKSNIAIRAR